ncbi:MAG: hypothetical protein OXF54_16625 [Caldilineaceae bacterium]|nr:hypothetical protein [Caldilineaceae bacterium]
MSSPTLGSVAKESISIRLLMAAQFDEAKRWWLWANVSRLLVVIVTVISLFWKEWLDWIWLLPAGFTVTHSLLQWRADTLQGKADAITRQLELQDGFGWKISEQEKADLSLEVSDKVKKKAQGTEESPYFDSRQEAFARRAVENLKQSAWYTRHLAKKMAKYVFVLCAFAAVLALISIFVIVFSPPLHRWGPNIGRIVIIVLVFVVAYGYLRLGFQYRSLSSQAEKSSNRASRLLELETLTEIQAIRLLHEYQIARVTAPMIPGWIWNIMKGDLNRLWEQQVSR